MTDGGLRPEVCDQAYWWELLGVEVSNLSELFWAHLITRRQPPYLLL